MPPLLPAAFYQLLKEWGITLIEAPADEFHASNGLSLNVLPVRPNEVIMVAGFPKTKGCDGSGGLQGRDLRGRRAVHCLRGRPDLPDPAGPAAGCMNRRTFHRAPEGERRQELIEATLDTIAELGLRGATVRQIAIRAGVTAGLVRHYFASKDQMVEEAYRSVLATFAAKATDVTGDPGTRLKRFITLNLDSPGRQ